MPLTPKDLAKQAMEMSAESRAELAELLVESLGSQSLGKIDEAWLAEAKRRRDQIRSGEAQTVLVEEVFEKVRSTLKQ